VAQSVVVPHFGGDGCLGIVPGLVGRQHRIPVGDRKDLEVALVVRTPDLPGKEF
jgi:hypothetical protein